MARVQRPEHFESSEGHFFQNEPGLVELIEAFDLRLVNKGTNLLIMVPNPELYDGEIPFCLKYVTFDQKPLDSRLQRLVLQGIKNQRSLEGKASVQRVFKDGFYLGIPGLLQLEFVQGQTWLERYKTGQGVDGAGYTPEHAYVDARAIYDHIVRPMNKEGVIHRDIKPANVIFRKGDDIPVGIDLSLAVTYQQHRTQPRAGTIAYVSDNHTHFHHVDPVALGISMVQAAYAYLETDAIRGGLFKGALPFDLRAAFVGEQRDFLDYLLEQGKHDPAVEHLGVPRRYLPVVARRRDVDLAEFDTVPTPLLVPGIAETYVGIGPAN